MRTKIEERKLQRKLKRQKNRVQETAKQQQPKPYQKRQPRPQDDTRALQKFAERQPGLYQLLAQDNLVKDISTETNKRSNDVDEIMMRKYAKKLRLKNGEAGESFKKDGLDFILDVFDQKESSEDEDSAEAETRGTDCEAMEDYDSEEDYESGEESQIDSDSDEEQESEVSSDEEEVTEGEFEEFHGIQGDENTEEEQEPQIEQTPPPPPRKQQEQPKTDEYMRLRKTIQGQLNRLSEANIDSIFQAMEKFYGSNPRHDVTEIIINCIVKAVGDSANLLDSYIIVYACLVAHIYHFIGVDIGANFVQQLTERIEQVYKELPNAEDEVASKRCLNLITLLCHLFNFNVVSGALLFDLGKEYAQKLEENDVELILKIVRIAGKRMRADSPSALKDFITVLMSTARQKDARSGRFKFMLEQIQDLKNNKGNVKVTDNSDIHERLFKQMKNNLRKRSLTDQEPLRCTLNDIRLIEEKGKWWVVGAFCKVDHKIKQGLEGKSSNEGELMVLARKLGINTDVRRAIFTIIMSASDCLEAYEKLLKLTLNDVQQREIMRILLLCCQKEKAYNPYYAVLAEKLCSYEYNHKITLQFALWDWFKLLQPGQKQKIPLGQISNMAQFYGHLIKKQCLGVHLLKDIDFANLVRRFESQGSPDRICVFLQILLTQLLITDETRDTDALVTIKETFKRVATDDDLKMLRNGLIVVLIKILLDRMDEEVWPWLKLCASKNPLLKKQSDQELALSFKERVLACKKHLSK